MNKGLVASLSCAFLVVGCAKSSNEVATSYVSPVQYQHMNCAQINAELVRVAGRVSDLGGQLDEASANDAAITGVGMILFWPALFALGGTDGQEAEYGRLKGEYEALNQLAMQNNCMGGGATTYTQTGGGITVNGSNAAKLEEAARLCKKQGVPENTETFGKCVLNLSE